MTETELSRSEIVRILQEWDKTLDRPYHIVICGGAAAIVKYGVDRSTGDIDILDEDFDVETFNKSIEEVFKNTDLPLSTINIDSRNYINSLTPNFRNRLEPSNEKYENLKVDYICKADLLSMKLLALRTEKDRGVEFDGKTDLHDIIKLNVEKKDLPVIYSNIINYANQFSAHTEKHTMNAHIINNFQANRALNTLEDLGFKNPSKNASDVKSLLDLIQFYEKNTGKQPFYPDIENWQKSILLKTNPADIAERIGKETDTPIDGEPEGMDFI
jgi:hypothetical protein